MMTLHCLDFLNGEFTACSVNAHLRLHTFLVCVVQQGGDDVTNCKWIELQLATFDFVDL